MHLSRPRTPLPQIADQASPIELLARRAVRLAHVVEAISRRRDVRELRAQILLLLLDLACPVAAAPRKRWYVPGAVARLGAEGLRRAWRGYYGVAPPALRTLRSHISALEHGLAIVVSPGDWLPIARDPQRPEIRPRYPQTIHLLEHERDAQWWEAEGLAIAARHPETRQNPDAWRKRFAGWRRRAAELERQPLLPFLEPIQAEASRPLVAGRVDDPTAQRAAAAAIQRAATSHSREPLALLAALRAHGAPLHGSRVQAQLASEPARLAAAAALLARALMRGDRIRNRSGWLVRAFRSAPELGRSRAWRADPRAPNWELRL